MSQAKTPLLTLSITGLSHDGRGVGRLEGKTYFVADAIPGDEVEVRVIEETARYNVAQAVKRVVDSVDRVEPFCPLFNQCGGCQLQHQSLEAQRHWKQANFFDALHKTLDMRKCQIAPAIVGEGQGYRRRARFVWGRNKADKEARFGFRVKHSNEIVDVTSCPVLEDALNEQLTQQRANYLATASRQLKEVTWVKANEGVLFSHYADGQAAEQTGYYCINKLKIGFNAEGFVQVNEALNLKMIEQAQAWLDLSKNDILLDLFCGVGNFTLPLAQQVKQVVGIEGEASLVAQAKLNAEENHLSDRVNFYKANLFEEMTQAQWFYKQTYDKVLLDPGRQGAQLVCEKMGQLKPKKIAYVSCNAATLVRDVKLLAQQGYQIRKANMIDMFPQTMHTEVMVLLELKPKRSSNQKRKIFRL